MPNKIEGIAQLNSNTLAIANDNNYDIGTFMNGQNQGAGVKSTLLIVDHVPLKAEDQP